MNGHFLRFGIDAQWMYHYTARDAQSYLWLQEKMHWKMSVQQVFIFNNTVTPLTNVKQVTTKIKKNKT